MTGDKALAAQLADRDVARLERAIRATHPTTPTLSFAELEQLPPEGLPDLGAMSFVIGMRGELTKQAAAQAARVWRQTRARHPDVPFTVSIAGYDDDPRELWQFPDVCRFVRRFAREAGLDDLGGRV